MIQKQLFGVFQLFAPGVKYLYQKNTWRIHKSSSFIKNDLKNEITLAQARNQGGSRGEKPP